MSREGEDMAVATRTGVDDEELHALLDGETGALLGASLAPVEPSAGMRAEILERIKGVEQDGAAPAPGAHSETGRADASRGPVADDAEALAPVIPLRRRRAWRYTAQAAAAVALISAGFGAGYGSGYGSGYDGGHDTAMEHVTPMIDYTHLNQAQDVRRVSDTMPDGHVATLTWSEGMSMTALSLPAAMPAPASGTTLQMWLEDPSSGITSLGAYSPDEGTTFTFLPATPRPGQRVLITAEPAGGSARPTTKPLVVLAVGGRGGDEGSGQGAGPSGPAAAPSSPAASHA
ncbi:anti-sigma factor [Actinomyces timonensis]|uniref:Anti-sigma factor n=1 Tax=Actinomyces timonensis TaxID=1288391 RepID=A0AAU8N4H7_9ACTO